MPQGASACMGKGKYNNINGSYLAGPTRRLQFHSCLKKEKGSSGLERRRSERASWRKALARDLKGGDDGMI